MIFAKLDGERVIASRDLERVNYQCPHCKSVVILKKGDIKVPHFSHKSKGDCEHEPESELHVAMKMKVAKILGIDDKYVEYCHRMKDGTRVISDVYDPSTNTAYEVQCSPLAAATMTLRWLKYEALGINQVWLFKEEAFGRCYSQHCIKKTNQGLYFNEDKELIWIYGISSYYNKKYYESNREAFTSFDQVIPIRSKDYYYYRGDYGGSIITYKPTIVPEEEPAKEIKYEYDPDKMYGGTAYKRYRKETLKLKYGKDWWKHNE